MVNYENSINSFKIADNIKNTYKFNGVIYAKDLVKTGCDLEKTYGIPIINNHEKESYDDADVVIEDDVVFVGLEEAV